MMYRSVILGLMFVIILAGFGYEAYLNIPYYPESEAPNPEKNMLDIYTPDLISCGVPVVFFVHGGTWMYGDRRGFRIMGENLADEEGLIVVIISYRLSDSLHPEVVHPDHITDVAQAFKWTYENIGLYGGNPAKIFVMGHSAGAHLATLLATNTAYLEAAGASIENIEGVLSFGMGVYDIPGLYNELGMLAPIVWPYLPFGDIFTDDEDIWRDASPKYHLHENMPPFVFFVGDEDMEHIIGGDVGGMGMVFLPGEIHAVYDDFNEYQETDTFWIEGDHDESFANFIFDPGSRARFLAMQFIIEHTEAIAEKPLPQRLAISTSPNPFNSACRIVVPNAKRIIIRDNLGRIVGKSSSSPFIWQPSKDLPSGVYTVEAFGDNGAETVNIIYQK